MGLTGAVTHRFANPARIKCWRDPQAETRKRQRQLERERRGLKYRILEIEREILRNQRALARAR